MATVSFSGVGKVYRDGTRALDDFNLDVADGEFMVFVGPSGCGKTTALRMVAGLEDITEGEIRIGDVVVNGLHPRKRDIAMVFQNYALYPHMTVYRNIAFALKVRKTPPEEIKRRVDEAARILGLAGELQRKPAQLSGPTWPALAPPWRATSARRSAWASGPNSWRTLPWPGRCPSRAGSAARWSRPSCSARRCSPTSRSRPRPSSRRRCARCSRTSI